MKTFPEFLAFVTAKAGGISPDAGKWLSVRNSADGNASEVLIYNQIGRDWTGQDGIAAKDFSETMAQIPKGRKINCRINSVGGNVWDGMAIYSMLHARKADVTCYVDGIAGSIASVIACAGSRTIMPKNSLMMVHAPRTLAEGDAREMRVTADKLDAHAAAIASVYAEKMGCTQAAALKMIEKETWFTGEEAKAKGLCDACTEEVRIAAMVKDFDFAKFRQLPEALRGEKQPTDTIMNKTQMLALLKENGVVLDAAATDDQIFAKLKELMAKPAAPPAPTAPQNVVDVTAQLTAIREQLETARKADVSAKVQSHVDDGRVTVADKDFWITQAMANPAVLDKLANMPQQLPGNAPLNVTAKIEVGASVAEIAKAIGAFDAPMNSIVKGNNVAMKEVTNAAFQRAAFIEKHRGQLNAVFNAAGDNTIATELKRNVIMQTVVKDFARRVLALNQFSTVFQNVPLEGTNKVEVPYYDLDASASQVFAASTGYATIGETTTDKREITVGTMPSGNGGRWYQAMSFTSEEIARQPWLKVMELAQLKADKLAYDIVQKVLSIITAANYGTAAITSGADAFDSDDLADMVTACKRWPEQGRSLFLDTAYHVALLKDQSFKHALNAASDLAIKEGRLNPRVFGFDYIEIPTIPGNSENLVGFAAHKSAILCAFAPVPPIEEVRNAGTTYRIYVDPVTGIAIEYRTYGSNVLDTAYHIMESSFGFEKGNYYQSATKDGALKRIVSA